MRSVRVRVYGCVMVCGHTMVYSVLRAHGVYGCTVFTGACTVFTGARCSPVHGVHGCTMFYGCMMLYGCTLFSSMHYLYRLAGRSARRGGAPHHDRCRGCCGCTVRLLAVGATPERPATVDCRCTTTCSHRSETGSARHGTRLAQHCTPKHEPGASRCSVA